MGLLFTYGLTYGGALVSLFNPFIGLLIYICFAIIRPESMWYWSVPEGNYSRIVAIGLLAGWAFRGFGSWQFGRSRPMVVFLLCYFAWCLVLLPRAINPTSAWFFVEITAKIVLPFMVGITTIDSVVKLKQLAWTILLSQGYVAYELNLTYFNGYNRLYEEGFGNMDNNCNAIAFVTCVGFAYFLGNSVRTWWRKAIAFGAAVFLVHAIFFSFSRGGMLALVVTGGTAFFLIPKSPRHYVVFVLFALVSLRLAGAEVIARFGTTFAEAGQRDESAESRLQLWAACWDSMLAQPWGVGPLQWPEIAQQYGFRAGKFAHTLWLQIGAELGFPGLVSLALFYLYCIAKLWPYARGRRTVADPWVREASRMVVAGLIGFIVAAQFVSLWALELPYYVALIGAGVLKLQSVAAADACKSRVAATRLAIAAPKNRCLAVTR